jgi:hypothetical protein
VPAFPFHPTYIVTTSSSGGFVNEIDVWIIIQLEMMVEISSFGEPFDHARDYAGLMGYNRFRAAP